MTSLDRRTYATGAGSLSRTANLSKMEQEQGHNITPPPVNRARKLLIIADDVIHIAVALLLVAAAVVMLGYAVGNFSDLSISSMLLVVNDALFVLIIAEVLWTIIRYLRREKFSLAPFLFIGIISSLRRILVIDAQMSVGESEHGFYESIVELGVHAGIIFVLVVAYYIVKKARALDQEAD